MGAAELGGAAESVCGERTKLRREREQATCCCKWDKSEREKWSYLFARLPS